MVRGPIGPVGTDPAYYYKNCLFWQEHSHVPPAMFGKGPIQTHRRSLSPEQVKVCTCRELTLVALKNLRHSEGSG